MVSPVSTFPEYCPDCGSQLSLVVMEGRERAYCSTCERPIYRNAKPCAGALVVDSDAVLLVERTNPPAVGSWSLPAGFLEYDEPPAEAAARELREETNLRVRPDELSFFDTRLIANSDGICVLVMIYRTAVGTTRGSVEAGSDAAAARFWNLDALDAAGETLEPGYETIFRTAVSDG